jgi:GTP-binding protein
MLCDRKSLAKVSHTPGKTRLINHFNINDTWFLGDLPGYGYARLSKTERSRLEKMIGDYLLKRDPLRLTFVLIDSRHELLAIDRQFILWLSGHRVPFVIIMTKADKLTRNQLAVNLRSVEKSLADLNPVPVILTSSSIDKRGKEEILKVIEGFPGI